MDINYTEMRERDYINKMFERLNIRPLPEHIDSKKLIEMVQQKSCKEDEPKDD